MIIRRYRIQPSSIPGAGKGVFLSESAVCGSVVVAPTDVRDAHLVNRAALDRLPSEVQLTSIRWFEDYCTVDPQHSDEFYINHSFEPNGLWHLGFVFALRDLEAGDELTVDYRMLLNEGETPGFRDSMTGREISGFSWQENLRRSTSMLQQITGNRQPVPAMDC